MPCPENLGECLLLREGTTVASEYTGASDLLNNIIPNVYVAAGIVIFFMILFGGYSIIVGGSDTHKLDEGKKTITSAIIGLLVLFASYWIIQLIQVITGVPILNSGL